MCTTFVLYDLTNYAFVKKIFKTICRKTPYIFSGPGELFGTTTQVKSKVSPGIYEDCPILCKNFKTLALIVTEEMRGQERPLKIN